jgi:hypothetical protein
MCCALARENKNEYMYIYIYINNIYARRSEFAALPAHGLSWLSFATHIVCYSAPR